MATDETFGAKLELMERAIGFQFPVRAFSNDGLALLLGTSAETMSRKKTGKAHVTGRDLSVLTRQFGLARYGFQTGMFSEPLAQFEKRMKRVEKRAVSEEPADLARKLMVDRARAQNGTVAFDVRSGHRGGIGAVNPQPSVPQLTVNDMVGIRVTVPSDGHLIVINDDKRGPVSMLMPSQFARDTAVKSGTVHVPTSTDFRYFPVAGPAGLYRVIAVWSPFQPQLALLQGETCGPPRDLRTEEFQELAGFLKAEARWGRPFRVAIGDYAVIDA
jgi:hypothetical protein